jgi:hypothetical protein
VIDIDPVQVHEPGQKILIYLATGKEHHQAHNACLKIGVSQVMKVIDRDPVRHINLKTVVIQQTDYLGPPHNTHPEREVDLMISKDREVAQLNEIKRVEVGPVKNEHQ